MYARTISIISGKGGVGKTVITANLGIALSKYRRVIVLDADLAMANLSIVLGMKPKVTLHDVLMGSATVEDSIYDAYGVKVVPTGISLDGFEKSKPEDMFKVIREILENCDILLLDAPAGAERTTIIATMTSEDCIIVTNPDVSAITDATKSRIIAERLKTNVRGFILNRYKKEIKIKPDKIEDVLRVPLLGIIPEDPTVSIHQTEPFIVKDPYSPASKAIYNIAKQIIHEEKNWEHSNSLKRIQFALSRRLS